MARQSKILKGGRASSKRSQFVPGTAARYLRVEVDGNKLPAVVLEVDRFFRSQIKMEFFNELWEAVYKSAKHRIEVSREDTGTTPTGKMLRGLESFDDESDTMLFKLNPNTPYSQMHERMQYTKIYAGGRGMAFPEIGDTRGGNYPRRIIYKKNSTLTNDYYRNVTRLASTSVPVNVQVYKSAGSPAHVVQKGYGWFSVAIQETMNPRVVQRLLRTAIKTYQTYYAGR